MHFSLICRPSSPLPPPNSMRRLHVHAIPSAADARLGMPLCPWTEVTAGRKSLSNIWRGTMLVEDAIPSDTSLMWPGNSPQSIFSKLDTIVQALADIKPGSQYFQSTEGRNASSKLKRQDRQLPMVGIAVF